MDHNQTKNVLRKAQVISNLNSSLGGQVVEPSQEITLEEFQERLKKGEKFFTVSDIERFKSDVRNNINKAYTPEEKEKINSLSEKELSLLKAVVVVNPLGNKFKFFTEIETQE